MRVLPEFCDTLKDAADAANRVQNSMIAEMIPVDGGCAIDIVNYAAAECFEEASFVDGRVFVDGQNVFLNKSSVAYHPVETSDHVEVEFPVCLEDEGEQVGVLKDNFGCDVRTVHYHGGVAHIHASCPLDSASSLVDHLADYGMNVERALELVALRE